MDKNSETYMLGYSDGAEMFEMTWEKELEIAELYQNELKKLKEDKIFKEELFLQKLMELTYDVKKTIDEIDEYRRINKTEALPLDKAFGPYNKCFDIYQFLYDI